MHDRDRGINRTYTYGKTCNTKNVYGHAQFGENYNLI